MFYQLFLSPQVKRCAIINYKHGVYTLTLKVPNLGGGRLCPRKKKRLKIPRKKKRPKILLPMVCSPPGGLPRPHKKTKDLRPQETRKYQESAKTPWNDSLVPSLPAKIKILLILAKNC